MNMENYEEYKVYSFDEANELESKYIAFEKGVEKKIVIQNWKIIKKLNKYKNEKMFAFVADVLEEDGNSCEKILDSFSRPLRVALSAPLRELSPETKVEITILKTGEGVDTKYKLVSHSQKVEATSK